MTEYQQQQAKCLHEILRLTSRQNEAGACTHAEQVFATIEAMDAAESDVVEAPLR